jgi:hypothetical protein
MMIKQQLFITVHDLPDQLPPQPLQDATRRNRRGVNPFVALLASHFHSGSDQLGPDAPAAVLFRNE